ncbi:MAG: hypothetical protein KAR47_03155, partial [Planctomycetes bacterium]|nr:hypothetical protein [Planctomycetota bacterium]
KAISVVDGISFASSNADYTISFENFSDSQAMYKIISRGHCGREGHWVIEALVTQAVTGWDIGRTRVPAGSHMLNEIPAFFMKDDIIEMPLHINCHGWPVDYIWPEDGDADIRLLGKTALTHRVSMGESRYRSWGRDKDKYARIIGRFKGGIFFDQPNSKISGPASRSSIEKRVQRFEHDTKSAFNFSKRTGNQPRISPVIPAVDERVNVPAVQLEFYLKSNTGMVRVTNNCTVTTLPGGKFDYVRDFDSSSHAYKPSLVYGYHYARSYNRSVTYDGPIAGSYVSQKITLPSGKVAETEKGGHIFVDGNVIVGGAVQSIGDQWQINIKLVPGFTKWYPSKLKGRLTVVATGNIWVVSPLEYDGPQFSETASDGNLVKRAPLSDNDNVLHLFSQHGTVKIIDPRLSRYLPRQSYQPIKYTDQEGAQLEYQPVAAKGFGGSYFYRILPSSMVVQAAITCGGGSWGMENLGSSSRRFDKEATLILAGAIVEPVQGAVLHGAGGYKRNYYFDERFLNGILSCNMGLQSKYIVAPGGWSDRDYQEYALLSP